MPDHDDTRELADVPLAEWVTELRGGAGGVPARDVRAMRSASRQRAADRPRGPEMARVLDGAIPDGGVRFRLYRPVLEPRPLIVYAHGGMWLLGDLETHDRTCRRLALAVDASVLAVEPRLAPEWPWPAAVDDLAGAIAWAMGTPPELGNGGRVVAVAGDSSGGHLAVLATVKLRDGGASFPPLVLLAYPNADLTLSQQSTREYGTGWGLEADDLEWAIDQWVPSGVDRSAPEVSPLAADLAGIEAALVVTADHDPLRDEGDALAAALARAGADVRHRREAGMVHGFLQALDLFSPAAAAASDRFLADAGELVRRQLEGS